MTKILMFAGSARKASTNKQLINATAEIAKQQDAEVTLVDLADYPIPLYDGDLEEANGAPENAKKLHDLLASHDALIIASPEYNGLPSPLLKNTIDWITRIDVKVFTGKKAAIIAASPGGLGGMRGLPHLRALLTNINTIVIPQQAAIGGAMQAFDENGKLKDEKQHAMIESVVKSLIDMC